MPSNDLVKYLDGSFAILITGERGTGKTKLVNRGLNTVQLNDVEGYPNKTIVERLHGGQSYPNFEKTLKEKLLASKEGIFIIEDLENFDRQSQITLFQYLSTVSGGFYEIFQPGDNVRNQIIATSSSPLPRLYNEKNFLPLIDRLAQQVVELKPVRWYNTDGKKIYLKEVWRAMQFKHNGQILDYPENDLSKDFYEWLNELYLAGNFRDLEKIAIYIWRYCIQELKTRSLLDYVKANFEPHIYEPESHFFKYGASADTILTDFKAQLADWAEKKYPDTKILLEKLNIAEKTLYNWKNRK